MGAGVCKGSLETLHRNPPVVAVDLAAKMNGARHGLGGWQLLPTMELTQPALPFHTNQTDRPAEVDLTVKHSVDFRILSGQQRDPIVEQCITGLNSNVERPQKVGAWPPEAFQLEGAGRGQRKVGSQRIAAE